jgi:phospholipid transport system transporter-binding protein
MSQAASLASLGNGQFALAGDLVFDQVACLLGEGDAAFGALPRADIDLAKVERADSAGLALLLEWSIVARDADRVVNYLNIPPPLAALAGISEVATLLVAGAADAG